VAANYEAQRLNTWNEQTLSSVAIQTESLSSVFFVKNMNEFKFNNSFNALFESQILPRFETVVNAITNSKNLNTSHDGSDITLSLFRGLELSIQTLGEPLPSFSHGTYSQFENIHKYELPFPFLK
jgi:hypothetical protein